MKISINKTIPMLKRSTLLALALGAFAVCNSFGQSAVLRPSDSIEIRLSGVPADFVSEVTSQYTVDDEGNLNLPYIPPVKVSGLSMSQAQAAIENQYRQAEIYSSPRILISTQASQRFVNVGGAVRGPGRLPWTSDLTLTTAINAMGGLNEYGSEKKVWLIRAGQRTPYDLRKIKKEPSTDPKIIPGDQIEVGQSMF